jgi:hypothetical protein
MARVAFLFTILLYSHILQADVSVYTVEGNIQAAFPGKPQYVGELGQGRQRHRSYQIADGKNVLAYAVTYQVGRTKFKQKDVADALRQYIKGQSLVVSGKIESFVPVRIQENEGAHFVIAYTLNGASVRKYGAVMYRDGQFFQWTVQDFPGISRQSGAHIFQAYVKHFSIK